MGRIILTLRSDLCASSGQSFSSIVDSEIVTDSFGLPYIPARRMKGCLREAADYIGSDIVDRLFGVKGSKNSGELKIGNGYLKDRKELEIVLTARSDFSSQRVTELFTSVKTQTAIDGGTVKDSSLRFTRTLSHYLPYNPDEETCFIFRVSGVSKEDATEFERICKALRHIGLMRTRGLGFVKAEYEQVDENSSASNTVIFKRDKNFLLPLHILLTEPLLIASCDNNACVEYVPGTAVLGAFARLAVIAGMDDDEFSDLFLLGKVRYGNLYISDKKGTRTIPAPHFMRKLKSTKREKDGVIITEHQAKEGMPVSDSEKFDPNEDIPKALKNKSVSSMNLSNIIDVLTETQYHHSRGEDAMLYTQDSISAGQYLYGEIESSDKALLERLKGILVNGDLRLGRSRSAQYSGCKLLDCKRQDTVSTAPAGKRFVFCLESDAVLFNNNGINTTDPKELKNALGIPRKTEVEYDLGFKLIHGYNAKRNMRNLPVAAFAMGSTVKAELPCAPSCEPYIGYRNAEGFGRVRVYSEEDIINNTIPSDEVIASRSEPVDESGHQIERNVIELFGAFLDGRVAAAEAMKHAEDVYREKESTFSKAGLNAAFIGTVSRMVETAESAESVFDRIAKIKDKAKSDSISDILRKAFPESAPEKIKLDCMLTVLRLAKYKLRLEKKGGGSNE